MTNHIQLPLPLPDATIEIELTKGQVTIIDVVDADLAQFKWNAQKSRNTYYPRRASGIMMHRVILGRKLGRELESTEQCDHINGDGLDNRRANLRVATHAQNQRNRGRNKNSKSGYVGVRPRGEKWRASITVNGKSIELGTFDTPEDAHEAYKEAAKKYHGRFARFE